MSWTLDLLMVYSLTDKLLKLDIKINKKIT